MYSMIFFLLLWDLDLDFLLLELLFGGEAVVDYAVVVGSGDGGGRRVMG
jgi:hypothetical protein